MSKLVFSLSERIACDHLDRMPSEQRIRLLSQVESISTKVAEHGESWTTVVVLSVPPGTTDRTILSICTQVGVEVSERIIRSDYDCSGKSFGGPATIERGKVQRCRWGGDHQTVIVRVSRSLDV